MQRFRLRGVTTAEQPHGKQAKYPKDHITLLLEQVGGYGTALLVELPEQYVAPADAPLYDSPQMEKIRRGEQIERAYAVWNILRPIAYRKTYVDVYPVAPDIVHLEVWSTSHGGACDLGESSFNARIEYVQLAWPCVLQPTHSLYAAEFVETRWNRIVDDFEPRPTYNVWHSAAD